LDPAVLIDFGTQLCENPPQWRDSSALEDFFSWVLRAVRGGTIAATSAHYGSSAFPAEIGMVLKAAVLGLAVILAALAGWTDWRSRRIPNWLTVPGLLVGIAVNAVAGGWGGIKTSLLGAGLGLLLLLPFVFVRSLGAGDWKLAGALGAFVGPGILVDVLMGSVFVAGIMALGLVIYKRRLKQTLRNMGRLLASLFTFHMPGSEVSLDNPQSLKIPYGVALALTTLLYGVWNWKMGGPR
jgi:prepilin peptidase CpaA